MPEYIISLTFRYKVSAPTKEVAKYQVKERIPAPEDDPPGELLAYFMRAKQLK